MSWNEYLEIFVERLRNMYNTELSSIGVEPEAIKEINPYFSMVMFPKPCQIKVFEFSSINRVLWIVSSEENKPDMEFEIVEEIKELPTVFVKSNKRYKPYKNCFALAEKELGFFHARLQDEKSPIDIILDKKTRALLFLTNPRKMLHPSKLALQFFYENRMSILWLANRYRLEKTASDILREVKTLSKTEPSPAIGEAEKIIEDALAKLRKIDEYEQKLIWMENELTGLSRLIGTRTFGERKALLAEIDKLNTRIDALSNVINTYDKVLNQLSSFITWIKYATILVPIAVVSAPIVELLLRYLFGI